MLRRYVRTEIILKPELQDNLLEAHNQQRQLANVLEEALKISSGNVRLKEALETAQNHAAGLKDFLAILTTTRYYNEQCPPSAAGIAQKTFDIPEILEEILCHVENKRALLRAQQVNRQFRDAINGSVRLQRLLSLHPEGPLFPDLRIHMPGNGYEFPFEFYATEVQYIEGDRAGREARVEALISAYFFSRGLRHTVSIGSRCRAMYICHPPMQEITAYTDCCSPSRQRRQPEVFFHGPGHCLVTNKDGLTIGDLWDATERLKEEHRYCARAPKTLLNEDGTVRVKVVFQTTITVSKDDPWAIRARDKHARDAALRRKKYLEDERLTAYAAARQDAIENGEKVMTMAEWQKAEDEDESEDDIQP